MLKGLGTTLHWDFGDCNRLFLEYCCGDESRFGQQTKKSKGCYVLRLTQREDMTKLEGIALALSCVKAWCKSRDPRMIIIWGSIPCTGGSNWWNINKRGASPEGLLDHQRLIETFKILWRGCIFQVILDCGGAVANEWPSSCSYWRYRKVRSFLPNTRWN